MNINVGSGSMTIKDTKEKVIHIIDSSNNHKDIFYDRNSIADVYVPYNERDNQSNATLVNSSNGINDDGQYIYDNGSYSSIVAGAGDDTIILSGYADRSSVYSGAGNDIITQIGNNYYPTIRAGVGNDTINYRVWADGLIQYAKGDGNDVINLKGRTIHNVLEKIDLLNGASISSYNINSSGDHVITMNDGGSITIKNLNYKYGPVKVHIDDNYYINGKFFNYLENESGTNSDDYIYISEKDQDSSINKIYNGGKGNDYITDDLRYIIKTVSGGEGNDTIQSGMANLISGDEGSDLIQYFGSVTDDDGDEISVINSSISGGDGNDTIEIQIESGLFEDLDEDYSYTDVDKVTINGGAGDDVIRNTFINKPSYYAQTTNLYDGSVLTDVASLSADGTTYTTIHTYTDSEETFSYKQIATLVYDRTIIYNSGDGNDTVEDFSSGDKLVLGIDDTTVKSTTKGNDIVLTIDDGSITLKKARGKTLNVVNSNGDSISVNTGNSVDSSVTLPAGLSFNSDKTGFIVENAYKGVLALSTYDSLNIIDADASKRTKAINITGNSYDNSLVGGSKGDTLNGGAGADTLVGGLGADYLTGGAGADVFVYSTGDGSDIITDFGTGDDIFKISKGEISTVSKKKSDVSITIGKGKVTFKDTAAKTISIEDADGNTNSSIVSGIYTTKNNNPSVSIIGGSFAESISNFASYTTIDGGAGNDSITNYNSNSIIDAGLGNDYIQNEGAYSTIEGGKGNDTVVVNGGTGNIIQYANGDGKDVIENYSEDSATIQITSGKITKVSNGGKKAPNDLIFTVGKGTITLKDGVGKNVSIIDEDGSITNQMYGASTITVTNSTTDTVDVSKDSAVIEIDASSRTRDITIIGNAKNNTIRSGEGNDILTGGKGKDVFIYSGGNDTITDYTAGQDIIQLNNTYLYDASLSGTVTGDDIVLYFDYNGSEYLGSLTIKNAVKFDRKGNYTGNKLTIIDAEGINTGAQLYDQSDVTVVNSDGNTIKANIEVINVNGSKHSKALTLIGNDENNSLIGGAGADTISGYSGDNILTGGKGKDFFVYVYGEGSDTITDYTPKQDTIQLRDGSISGYTVVDDDVILSVTNYTNGEITYATAYTGSIRIVNGKDKAITIIDHEGKETNETYNDPTELILTKNDSGKYDLTTGTYSSIKRVDGTKTTKGVELIANSNGNTLIGGKGKDILTGGRGADTFVYTSGGGNDTIRSYTAGDDIIQLGKKTAITSAAVSEIKDDDGNVTHANYVFTIGKNKLTIEDGATKTITFVDYDGNKIRYDADYTTSAAFEERFEDEIFADDNYNVDEFETIVKSENLIAVDYKFNDENNFVENNQIAFNDNKSDKK